MGDGNTTLTPRSTDHEVARSVAHEAGQVLLGVRAAARSDGDSRAMRDVGDRVSHTFILEQLAALRPDDVVLSEEGADDAGRLLRHRVWVVDPLDGTREFGEEGRDDWAVHIALCEDGVPVAGAVALPAQGVTLSTGRPLSALPISLPRPRIVISRSRPPAVIERLDSMGAEVLHMGSAGAKAMAVVRGDAEVYLHAGGQYEWDSAAPVAVAVAAGLHASRLDGASLVYNRPDPRLPDLLICRPELAAQIIGLLLPRHSSAATAMAPDAGFGRSMPPHAERPAV